MKRSRVLLLLYGVALLPFTSYGQSSQTGFPAFSSQAGGINLSNLNVHSSIPVVSRNGRGDRFAYSLEYDSASLWLYSTGAPSTLIGFYMPTPTFLGIPTFGWTNSLWGPGSAGTFNYSTATCSTNANATNYYGWSYTDLHGTVHLLPASLTVSSDASCGPTQASAFATDQSGFFFTVTGSGSGVAQDRSGNTFGGSSVITDRNGNQVSSGVLTDIGITDTLGTTALSSSSTSDSSGHTLSTIFTYPAPGGGTASVVVNYKVYPKVELGVLCPGSNGESDPLGAMSLVDNIVLGDGVSTYKFTYEPTPTSALGYVAGSTTGRLQTVTLPTGATIQYGYPGPNGGLSCYDGSLLNLTVTTSDGTTTYNRSVSASGSTTTVTDPQGNQTVLNFQPLMNPQSPRALNSNLNDWIETQRQIYQGSSSSGTLLQTVFTCYNGARPNCNNSTVNSPITEVSRFVQFPGGKENEQDVFVNNLGLTTEVDEYDFGSSGPEALLRKTILTYASLGNNILDRPASVAVCAPGGSDAACNGSGTKVAQTTFGYDEGSLASTSGITQHVAVSGARGNLTSVHRWLNTNNTTLTSTNTFDDTGNVVTTTDPGNHTTTAAYGACNGAFPTQLSLPDTQSGSTTIHHKTSATYDCGTGLVTSSTDQNGNVTSFLYDNMFRSTEVDYPDGGKTTSSYPDPNHVTVQRKIDSSRSTSSTTVLDGYGRVSRTALANGESTPYDQQDSCYDGNGRLSFRSYPYQGNAPNSTATCPNTSLAGDTFAYDAAGRTTSVTHSDGKSVTTTYGGLATEITDEGNGSTSISRILQKDGLGRLLSVCELYSGSALLGGGGTPGTCGMDISGTGFLTSYGYDTLGNLTSVAQGTLTNRSYTYDSLSRRTSETTPEAGTVTYTYNADSLLATRVRPTPNQGSSTVTTTNYSYDALHRLTGRSFSGDPTNTPAATFNYDESNVWGTNLANTAGRMTSEMVGSPLIAQQIFSYDSMGRPVLNAQCTPNTCNASPFVPYSLGYGYDLLGDITSASNGAGVSFGYSYNVAGRLTQMTSSLADNSHPDTLLTAAHYSPTSVTDLLGNGVVENVNFSARGLLQSQQVLLPSGQAATATVTVTGALNHTQPGDPGAPSSPIDSYLSGTTGQLWYLDSNHHLILVSVAQGAPTQTQDVTALAAGPVAAAGSQLTSYGNFATIFQGANQHLYQASFNGTNWGIQDLTTLAGTSTVGVPGTALASEFDNPNQRIFYFGTDNHLHELLWNGSAMSDQDLSAMSGGAAAAPGSKLATFGAIGTCNLALVYQGTNQHMYQTNITSPSCDGSTWSSGDLTAMANTSAVPAAGTALISYVNNPYEHDFYFGTDNHLHELLWSPNMTDHDLTGMTGGAQAAPGSTLAMFGAVPTCNLAVIYQGANGHMYQTWSCDGFNWTTGDLTAMANTTVVPASATALSSYVNNPYEHDFYQGTDNHVYELLWTGSNMLNIDVTPNSDADSGTVSLTVGQFTATACFGPSTNPACAGQAQHNDAGAVASALVSALNTPASPVTATLSGTSAINLTWKQSGPFTFGVSALSTTHDQPTLFSAPSFTSAATNFAGGNSGATAYSYSLGLAPDGQVTSANDFVNGNWAFTYDGFNRLLSSNKNSGQQTFTYDYDRYGNRWHQNAPQGGPAPQYIFDNNNHLNGSGVTYDALGEVQTDGLGNSFTWDAEGRLIQVNQGSTVVATYSYDAEGRRVHGANGEYVYDLGGNMITQFALNGTWSYGEIYVGDRHLATYSGGTTNFYHGDWLGTKRVMTALNGTTSLTCTGFAFGDGVNCGTGTNWSFNGFTDDIHDPETNLEHTLFRQYSGTEGRWLVPDPSGLASADPGNPQSWNRYAYVMNDPINSTDPTGLWPDGFDSGSIGGFGLCGFDASIGCGFFPFGGCAPYAVSCNGFPNFGALGIPPVISIPPLGFMPGEFQLPYRSLSQTIEDVLAGLPWNAPSSSCGDLAPCSPDFGGVGFVNSPTITWGQVAVRTAEGIEISLLRFLGVMSLLLTLEGDNKCTNPNLPCYHMAKGGDQNIRPSWAEPYGLPKEGESGKDFAERICREAGRDCGSGPGSDFEKLKKWADRRPKR